MTQNQKKMIIIGLLCFVIYVFVAARPIPIETVLSPRWFISLESNYPIAQPDTPEAPGDTSLLPFKIGNHNGAHFGYVNREGNFTINQVQKEHGYVSLSASNWAEYEAIPHTIDVRDPLNRSVLKIEGAKGYPLFLDQRIFLVGSEGNSLMAIDTTGSVLWTYNFASTLTAIDGGAGFILAGLLDGTVEVLDDKGQRVFLFEPGGSRISVILGCAISRDGTRLAVLSGIDLQRFLLLERYGGSLGNLEYKVIYHEFLEEGFRRPVHIKFIDNNSRIVFERQGGLGLYEISSRTSLKLPLAGEIQTIDDLGSDRLLFLVTSQSERHKRLVAIRLPGTLMMEAPFKGEHIFLGRQGSRVYLGGGTTLASFELEKK